MVLTWRAHLSFQKILVTSTFIFLWSTCILAQDGATQSRAEGFVTGVVVNSVTGAPVPRALVTIFPISGDVPGSNARPSRSTLTNGGGSFQFDHLARGTWMVNVKRPGFQDWPGSEGDDGPAQVFDSNNGQTNISVSLKPVTVIAGLVVDAAGEPVPGVHVQALRGRIEDGRLYYDVYAWATTDDRGRYRVANLWRGPYFLLAQASAAGYRTYSGPKLPATGIGESFTPLYYPGVPSRSGAALIYDSPGQEVRADLVLTMEPAYSVRGTLNGYVPGQVVELELLRESDDVAQGRVALNVANGEFEISDIVPGAYMIRATQGAANEQKGAEMPVQIVRANVAGLMIGLTPGADVICKIQAPASNSTDGDQFAGRAVNIQLLHDPKLTHNSGSTYFGRRQEDGSIRIPNVLPGKYAIRVRLPRGYYVASIQSGATDLLESPELSVSGGSVPEPIQIVLGNDGGSVVGKIATGGKRISGVEARLVSESKPGRPALKTSVDENGGFQFDQVPPGSYTVYAWKGAEVEYRNSAQLQQLGITGIGVDVAPNSKSTVELPAAVKVVP